jgi:hypothetical protein
MLGSRSYGGGQRHMLAVMSKTPHGFLHQSCSRTLDMDCSIHHRMYSEEFAVTLSCKSAGVPSLVFRKHSTIVMLCDSLTQSPLQSQLLLSIFLSGSTRPPMSSSMIEDARTAFAMVSRPFLIFAMAAAYADAGPCTDSRRHQQVCVGVRASTKTSCHIAYI